MCIIDIQSCGQHHATILTVYITPETATSPRVSSSPQRTSRRCHAVLRQPWRREIVVLNADVLDYTDCFDRLVASSAHTTHEPLKKSECKQPPDWCCTETVHAVHEFDRPLSGSLATNRAKLRCRQRHPLRIHVRTVCKHIASGEVRVPRGKRECT